MEASNAYVIVGNAALIKCEIPSFVSDLVEVVNWEDEEGNVHTKNSDYGIGQADVAHPKSCSATNYLQLAACRAEF